MPTLAIVEVQDSPNRTSLSAENTLAMTDGSTSNEPIESSTVIPTSTSIGEIPQKTMGVESAKQRSVTPAEEKEAPDITSGTKQKKRTKIQPTLASFFGAKKSISSPQATTSKAKKTSSNKRKTPSPPVNEKSPAKKCPAVGEPSPGQENLRPRKIFSPNGSKARKEEEAESQSPLADAEDDVSKSKMPVDNDSETIPPNLDDSTEEDNHEAKSSQSVACGVAKSSESPTGTQVEKHIELTSPKKTKDPTVGDEKPESTENSSKEEFSASPNDATAENSSVNAESNSKEGKSPKDANDVESAPAQNELPEQRLQMLHRNTEMRKRYLGRADNLISEAKAGIEEETFDIPPLKAESITAESTQDQEYPDVVVSNMALLIEGSHLPLSTLVTKVCKELEESHSNKWSEESVTAKIKLLAKRGAMFNTQTSKSNSNIFEDEDSDRMWRWEVTIIDLLPSEVVTKAKKARSARKKLSSNYNAVMKLVQTLDNAEKSISDLKVTNLENVSAKISTDEEKVLRFEREAEKKRLALQAKRKKQEELEAKRQEKERLAEEKRRAKELKKEEAEKKKIELEKQKQEQADAREAAKKQKIEERERLEQEKKLEEEKKKETLNKQKSCLMSFFGSSKKKQNSQKLEDDQTAESSPCPGVGDDEKICDSGEVKGFDADKFRSEIDSYQSHSAIPAKARNPAIESMVGSKRRTAKVDVSVYITVMPDEINPFDAQPFAELRTMRVPNKYRFLSFHEDTRPPYHGTWSKKSYLVTGRRPFGKDTSHLNYDYDSEAEWEEGDDEMGEDVEDETKDKEEEIEEEKDRIYDYDDGFCVADDQYLETDENVDDEDKELYKKKLQVSHSGGDAPIAVVNKIRIIAPLPGGIPYNGDRTYAAKCLEGVEMKEVQHVRDSLRGEILADPYLCLDAFPPPLNEEGVLKQDAPGQANSQKNGNDDYTKEEMIVLARFLHLNTLNSKEKLIEELRKDHMTSFASKAKATRKLDSIATKKRNPNATGVYWEVKREVLEELGLHDLIQKVVELEKEQAAAAAAAEAEKAKKEAEKAEKEESKKASEIKDAGASKSKSKKGKKRVALNTVATPNPEKKAKTAASSPKVKEKKPSMAASANLMASFLNKAKSPTKDKAADEKA